MNAVIINCLGGELLKRYLSDGYVSLGIYVKGLKPTWHTCQESYSMYADMSCIKPGDLVFLHCDSKIYGVFEAVTAFCEEPNVGMQFLSKNIHWSAKTDDANSGWRYHFDSQNTPYLDPGLYRQIAIRHCVQDGEILCFNSGFDANLVFRLKRLGRVQSIPDRWKYPDNSRIVRPIIFSDVDPLIELLRSANCRDSTRLSVKPKNMSAFRPITFVLDNRIVLSEKIVEGWLCQNLRTRDLNEIFGHFTSYVNNFQIGYLQGIDIFGYIEEGNKVLKYKVIEVKKDAAVFPDVFTQLREYMHWTTEFMAAGDARKVEGYIVASDFATDQVEFIKKYNRVDTRSMIRLVKFSYVSPTYDRLNLEVVSEN